MVSTESARDERRVEVLEDYYSPSRDFYEMSRTASTVVLGMYWDIVGFVRIMVQNTEAVLEVYRDNVGFVHVIVQNAVITFYVIASVLYSVVHSCTYTLMWLVQIVLERAHSSGPELKYSRPDPAGINKCRTFATRS
jgi:hypothetical protein